MIDVNQYISSTYEIAFMRLIYFEQSNILKILKETNDFEAYKLFIEAAQNDIFFGLEFIAKYLELNYLFKYGL